MEAEIRERTKALRAEQLVRELTVEEVSDAVRLLREDRESARPAKKQASKRKAKSTKSHSDTD